MLHIRPRDLQLQGMGRDQPSVLHPQRKPEVHSNLELFNQNSSYLGLECVALADGEVKERVPLGCARVHHCNQLVDALPEGQGCENTLFIRKRSKTIMKNTVLHNVGLE